MKLKCVNNLLIIYLKNEIIKDINFNVKDDLEKYLKNLFRSLNNYYNLEIKGFYNIRVYIDQVYGVVLEIEKENVDYYDYYDNSVDMRIVIINENFLYEIQDIDIIQEFGLIKQIYKYNNRFIIKHLTQDELIKISEFVDIIYNSKNLKKYLLNIDKIK